MATQKVPPPVELLYLPQDKEHLYGRCGHLPDDSLRYGR
jgi:hypothetical protein